MPETVYLVTAGVAIVFVGFAAIALGLWFQHQTKPDDPLQQVPIVPRATLPIHETNVRTIRKIKPAEAEPEVLVEKDFDPEGADQTRKTRLQELIRDTQTKQA